MWVGSVCVCGVRGRFSSALCRSITASACLLAFCLEVSNTAPQWQPPPSFPPHFSSGDLSIWSWLRNSFNSSFPEEELDGLAHLGSEDSPWSNHVECTWCDFGHQDPLLDEWLFSERRLGVSWANTRKKCLFSLRLIFLCSPPWIPCELDPRLQFRAHRSDPPNWFVLHLCLSVQENKWNSQLMDNLKTKKKNN